MSLVIIFNSKKENSNCCYNVPRIDTEVSYKIRPGLLPHNSMCTSHFYVNECIKVTFKIPFFHRCLFYFIFEAGPSSVAQAGFELLDSGDPPTLASSLARTASMHQHSPFQILYFRGPRDQPAGTVFFLFYLKTFNLRHWPAGLAHTRHFASSQQVHLELEGQPAGTSPSVLTVCKTGQRLVIITYGFNNLSMRLHMKCLSGLITSD